MTRVLVAIAIGLVAAAAFASATEPGRHDLAPREFTGMEAPDDHYWSSPVRRLAGEERQDRYDERLAISLALPQNTLAAAAVAVGVRYADARFAGSLLALAALVAVAVAWALRRELGVALVLVAFVATPPITGHLASDLGEATALGLTALWAAAAVARRWALAGAITALALSQKAWGLPLGLGTLAGVLGSVPRLRAFARAAIGVVAGLVVSVALATLVFGDDPVGFLLRPWRSTHETGAGSSALGWLVQAAFVGHHGVGASILPAYAAAAIVAVVAPPRSPSIAVLVATAAGFAFAGAFADAWRVLPALPLLAATLAGTPSPAAFLPPQQANGHGVLAMVPAALAVPQAIGAAIAAAGARPSAVVLAGASAAAIGVAWVVVRGLRDRPARARPVATIAAGVACVVASVASARVLADRSDHRLSLANEITVVLPEDASLIAYSFVASRFRGTLYYPPFQSLWEDEIAATRPRRLLRLRVPTFGESAPPGPAGYRVVETLLFPGEKTYNRDDARTTPLVIDEMVPP